MDYDDCPHCKKPILPGNDTALYMDSDTESMELLHYGCYCELKLEEEGGA